MTRQEPHVWRFLGLLLAFLILVGAAPPTIRLARPDDPRSPIEVVGLDPADARPEAFTLHTAGGPANSPTLLGETRLEDGTLRFRPRFPLEPGLRYRATVRLASGKTLTADLSVPKPPRSTPRASLVRVAPSPAVLPENLLRFYVEFSAPMARGEAYERIHLLDGAGQPIDMPFLELGEELWDSKAVRFTLLFDPGRIKNGLKPREELGPVLEAGKTYTLVVDRDWHDAEGDPLTEGFRKTFRVVSPMIKSPDPKTWKLDPPAAGTRGPVVAHFPAPLDRAMLGRVLHVTDRSGKAIPGAVAVGEGESSWSFTPISIWVDGDYAIAIDPSLEDVAGNSVARPFEVDVFDKAEQVVPVKPVRLKFAVGPTGGQKGESRPASR